MAVKNLQMKNKPNEAPAVCWKEFAWSHLRAYAKGRGVDVGRRSRADIERDLAELDKSEGVTV